MGARGGDSFYIQNRLLEALFDAFFRRKTPRFRLVSFVSSGDFSIQGIDVATTVLYSVFS
jgi:hypothetical protein